MKVKLFLYYDRKKTVLTIATTSGIIFYIAYLYMPRHLNYMCI